MLAACQNAALRVSRCLMSATPPSSKPRAGSGREDPTSKKRGSGDGEVRDNASPMDVGEEAQGSVLATPCKCPRKAHPQCLARWQLQQAGRSEETTCRFCKSQLADWKDCLTPSELKPEVEKVQPIMVVYFDGEIHRIPVRQGNEGLKEFTARIRELFKLPPEVDISLTFGCKEPMSGHHLKLEGMGAFDAAVHCASVAAAERQHKAGKRAAKGRNPEESSSDDGEDTTDLLQSTLGGPIQLPRNQRVSQSQQQQPQQQQHQPQQQRPQPVGGHVLQRFLPGQSTRQQQRQQQQQQQQCHQRADQHGNRHQRSNSNFPGFQQHMPTTPRHPAPASNIPRPAGQAPVIPVATNTYQPLYTRFMPWGDTVDWSHQGQLHGVPTPVTPQTAPNMCEEFSHQNPEGHQGMRAAQPTSWYPEIFPNRAPQPAANQQMHYSNMYGMYDGAGSSAQQTASDIMHEMSMAHQQNMAAGGMGSSHHMECDPRAVPSPAMLAAAQQLRDATWLPGPAQSSGADMGMLEATSMYRNNPGMHVGGLREDMVGTSNGALQRPSSAGQNYGVSNGVISRSKLNQVLSFFGIRPPQQYTLGTNVQLADE